MALSLPCIANGLALLLGWSVAAAAADGLEPLPEPLTLEQALGLADELDPQLQQAQAEVNLARAAAREADARTGVNVSVEGRARWIEPADQAPDNGHDDHKLSLFVRKNLYDFGRSDALEAAAAAELAGREQFYQDARQQRRIEIMRRYFTVLRSDLEFARDDEAMAVAYVTLDRLRTRQGLGQVSELEVLEMESQYQQVRRQRAVSEGRMRATRAQLAIALNRPGQLPGTLVPPKLSQAERVLPDYQQLLGKALTDNLQLQTLRKRQDAAQQRLEAAYAGRRPKLTGELEAAEYSRSFGSNDKLRAGVYLEVPLYDGGTTDSAVARQQAELYKVQAQLTEAERNLSQAVLELWLELSTLRVQQEQAAAQRNYRDLYLDRSRAVYEMELKADLGDAMVRLSEAQLNEADTRFQIALAWERMDALTGGPLPAVAVQQAGQ